MAGEKELKLEGKAVAALAIEMVDALVDLTENE